MARVGEVAEVTERRGVRPQSAGRRSARRPGGCRSATATGCDVDALPEPAQRRPPGRDRQVPPAQLAEGLMVGPEEEGVDERRVGLHGEHPVAGMSPTRAATSRGHCRTRNFHSGMSISVTTSGSARNGGAQPGDGAEHPVDDDRPRDGRVDTGSDRVGERAEVRQRRAGGDRGLVTYALEQVRCGAGVLDQALRKRPGGVRVVVELREDLVGLLAQGAGEVLQRGGVGQDVQDAGLVVGQLLRRRAGVRRDDQVGQRGCAVRRGPRERPAAP